MIFERQKITGKSSAPVLHLLALALAVSLSLFFIAPLASAGSSPGNAGTVTGEVVAINHANNVNTLTLRSSQIGQYPNDKLNIFVNSSTKISVCNSSEPVKDMTVGHNAKVTYHEVGGVPVANSISEQC